MYYYYWRNVLQVSKSVMHYILLAHDACCCCMCPMSVLARKKTAKNDPLGFDVLVEPSAFDIYPFIITTSICEGLDFIDPINIDDTYLFPFPHVTAAPSNNKVVCLRATKDSDKSYSATNLVIVDEVAGPFHPSRSEVCARFSGLATQLKEILRRMGNQVFILTLRNCIKRRWIISLLSLVERPGCRKNILGKIPYHLAA